MTAAALRPEHVSVNGVSMYTGAVPLFIRTFVAAVILNFAWELAQAPLYESMGNAWESARRCFVASLGDGVMILLVAAAGAALFQTAPWFAKPRLSTYTFAVCAGLAIAVGVEQWGVATARWAYLPRMPRVPLTDLGLVPVLQMAVLTPLSFWLGGKGSPTAAQSESQQRPRH